MVVAQKKSYILLVTPYFAPAWGYGGPPRINFDLAKYLVEQGHKVTVLTTDVLDGKKRSVPLIETMDGIDVVRFKNVSNWLAWNFKIFWPIGYKKYIQKHIVEYDFVYISDLRDYQNVPTYKACVQNDIPYSISAYGELPLTGGIKGLIKKYYDRRWGKEMLARATYLFGQTEHENALYLKYGGRKDQCQLLPLGIQFSDFVDAEPDRGFREKNGIPDDKKIILFIGRINELKGIDILVRALPKVLESVPKAHLLIIGRDDGYYLQKIKDLVKELNLNYDVTILGPIYGKDNHAAYLEASVFAFTPRHYEETSLACLGALALKTPVVTSEQASIPYLEESKAGFEISLDEKVLVQKLTLILKDPKLGEEMGKNGRGLIKKVFDVPKVGEQLKEMIRKAVENNF